MSLRHILQFIIYDPFRKIIAILFAFSLWFFVSLDGIYEQTKNIRVDYANIPDSLILSDSVTYIETVLRGRGSALMSAWAARITARCDLNQFRPGMYEIPVESLTIPIPFTNIVINHTIKEISFTIDTVIEKKTLIKVPIEGTLKQGYSINDVVVDDTISIIGPRDILQSTEFVFTETLDVKNKSTSFSKQLKIKPMSPLVQISQSIVTAEIIIDTTVEKMFVNIPLKLIFTPYQRVTSEKISLDTLLVQGPRDRMENLMKGDITVRITLSQLTSGDYNLPATIILPDYVTPVYSSPKRFAIKIY